MKKQYKYILTIIFLLLFSIQNFAQEDRITQLKHKLESIVVDAPGLNEKADLNVSNIGLPSFLQAIANAHKINISIDPQLNNIIITNNFSNATVSDILIFLAKQYELDIDFTGNILSIKKLKKEEKKTLYKTKIIPISYDKNNDLLNIDLKQDSLYAVFKLLTDRTGKNLVFAPGLENNKLTSYIQQMPFDTAMDKIAFANNLTVTKTRDNYYLFESAINFAITNSQGKKGQQQTPRRNRRSNFYFKVSDTVNNTLDVDFENIQISNIVYDIGQQLKLDMFTATPLDAAGSATVKAKNISLDLLFDKIFENTEYAFKKQNNIYYFGKRDQASLRNTVTIPLMYRSIEIMTGQNSGRSNLSGNRQSNSNYYGNNNNSSGNNRNGTSFNNSNNNRQNVNTNGTGFQNYGSKAEALISILPDEVKKNLEIQTDVELNSFIVSGPSQDIEKFREFVKYIDKPVPNINIEVMFIEVNRSSTVETGIDWGIGTEEVTTQGNMFPTTDFTLGATTINKIINSNRLGALNLGNLASVVPGFFMNIKAMESNGDIKVRSTPKISALNGHNANFSIGETTYYAVTERNIYGSQNPQTSEITNYFPLEAQTAINIRPIVSANGDITMEINVIQSSFNGKKVDENAPPGVNSREFTSVVRVKDQDLIVLGGLEEVTKNDSGSGVPFLARIPIIKWFFSKRKREDTKKKLVVFIKPTIIY